MNDLSWLLYVAGLAEAFSVLAGIVGILGCLFGIAVLFACYVAPADPQWEDSYEDQQRWHKAGKFVLYITVPLFVAFLFIPSKSTVYAIAVSEMGEQVIEQTDGRAMRALNAWLDRQIAGEDEPEEEQPR